MARIRSIKPEFFSSEQVVECSTNARLLFIGMWCFCDDGGVHPASAARLKMEVFPADPFSTQEVLAWVSELVRAKLITPYSVGGKDFWRVTGWHHQRIEKPTYIHPLSRRFGEESSNIRRGVADHSPPETIGDDRSRKETNGVESISIDDRKTIGNSPPIALRSSESSQSSGYVRKQGKAADAADLTDLDWSYVSSLVQDVARRVPPLTSKDRRAWIRFGVLAATAFSEQWLVESAAAAASQPSKRSRQALFVGVLKTKASEQYGVDEGNFRGLMRRIEIPTSVWQSNLLEVSS